MGHRVYSEYCQLIEVLRNHEVLPGTGKKSVFPTGPQERFEKIRVESLLIGGVELYLLWCRRGIKKIGINFDLRR